MLDFLKKAIKRTERDIAITGAVLGSVAAMEKLFPAMEHYSTLCLMYYDGASQTWESWRNDGAKPVDPWRGFLRWYHGRPQSECFVMVNNMGSDMVKRRDIKHYAIRYLERKKRKCGDKQP